MNWNGKVHRAASIFPMLDEATTASLAESIRADGLFHELTLWSDGTLLDGRNRMAACKLAGVQPRFDVHDGDPVAFIVASNLERRHLNESQRAMVADELANMPEGRPSETASNEAVSQNDAAALLHVSRASVQRAARVKREAPELAEKIVAGEMPLGRAERILRDRAAEDARRELIRKNPKPRRPRVDLRLGDFREVLADVTDTVDAVITDPPYGRDYLELLPALAEWADSALKDDGVLAVLYGHTFMPEAYALLSNHRPYRWTLCYLMAGPNYVAHHARIHSGWKPVLLYGSGPRLGDVIRTEGHAEGAKDAHVWGQDYGAFRELVERLTQPGQTVADPFAGSGTTLAAAYGAGRHVIGAEVDAAHFATMRSRLDVT